MNMPPPKNKKLLQLLANIDKSHSNLISVYAAVTFNIC